MIGTTVSHYEILEKLGEGGMGIVYKAHDTKIDRDVALKFLPSSLIAHEPERARFLQEARAAGALNHPNICTIHDIVTESETYFIVMEYVDGHTLRELIENGPLSTAVSIEYAIQIGEALQEAHSHGVVHRDIKPENIMVNSKNQVKVMDFGLAKLKGAIHLTRKSTTVGTAAYMSPEQARGEEVDLRTDIWSLGVIMYEMLTQRLPFKGEHEPALLYSIVNEEPEPIHNLRTNLPDGLEQIIHRCLAKDRDNRYGCVEDILTDLRAGETSPLGESRPKGIFDVILRSKTRGNIIRWGAALLVIVVAVIVGLIYLTPWQRSATLKGRVPSVAVLYLQNLGSAADEYFSYGLTEDIIIDLSKAGLVRVSPMKDVLRFRDSLKSLSDIANALRVQFVLSGSFRKEGDQLRFAAQLVEPTSGQSYWSERWEKSFKEVTAIKATVIREIIRALGISPNRVGEEELGKKSTLNAEAYEFYLKGKFYFRQRKNSQDIGIAKGFLERAIEVDSEFLPPRTILGELLRETQEYRSAMKTYKDGIALAERKGSLSDKALLTRGMAGLYWRMGRLDTALIYTNYALEVFTQIGDRAGEASALGNIGNVHYFLREYGKAMEFWKRALTIDQELDDKYGQAIRLNNISQLSIERGEYGEALDHLRYSIQLFSELHDQQGLALAYQNMGTCYSAQKDYHLSIDYNEKSAKIFESIQMRPDLINSLVALCQSQAALHLDSAAIETSTKLKSTISKSDLEFQQPATFWILSKTFKEMNQSGEANDYLSRSYELLIMKAKKLSSDQRKEYLTKDSVNKEIVAAWERMNRK